MAVHGKWEVPDSGGRGREIKLEERVWSCFFSFFSFSVWMTI